MPQQITEAGQAVEATAVAGKPGRFKIQLITPGWGSSGYYSADVLKEAARDRIWPAGTRNMMDHPTWSESQERPEGRIQDWASTLVEDAYWNGEALVATVEAYQPHATLLAERKDWIGVSIRAAAEVKSGEAEGRKGRVIEKIVRGETVDYVTQAGRGGKILAVLEAARNVSETTADERRAQLQRAVADAYGDGDADQFIWVQDFDPDQSVVYFSANDESTWSQPFEADDDEVRLTGERTEVRRVVTYVPASQQDATESTPAPIVPSSLAGQPTTESSQEMNMAEIADTELQTLRESAGQVTSLTEARDAAVAERDQAKTETGLLRVATDRALDALAESPLPLKLVRRVVREATADLPVKDGALDVDAFDAKVKESREDFESLLTEAGTGGKVLGFGQSVRPVAESGGYDASEEARKRVPFNRPAAQRG